MAQTQANRDRTDLGRIAADKPQAQNAFGAALERVLEILERGEESPVRANQNIAGKQRSAARGAIRFEFENDEAEPLPSLGRDANGPERDAERLCIFAAQQPRDFVAGHGEAKPA